MSQLRPACESLREAGITLLGIVIASPERARQYFRHAPICFPVATAPDRALHRAYGLPETVRTPEMRANTERRAAEVLREMGRPAPPGEAAVAFGASDGFEMSGEDDAEYQRPLQGTGRFLVGMDGVIRWARVDILYVPVPSPPELLALL
jgi:hypothetical protein